MSKTAWIWIGITVAATAFIAVANGCNLQDVVSIPVNEYVRDALMIDPDDRITLTMADGVYSDWLDFVQRQTRELQGDIEVGQERYQFIESFVSTGWGVAQTQLNAFPGGSLIVALLTGVSGLLIPKPGTKKAIQKATVKAFKQGMVIEREAGKEK